MTTRAELQRRLAAEFSRRGWEYDLAIAPAVVDEILDRGEVDPAALARKAPVAFRRHNRASIQDVADAIKRALSDSSPDRWPSATPMRLLFLAAGPLDEIRLRLDAEHRDIRDRIRAATARDQVLVEFAGAVRPTDIIDAMNRFTPTILHLAGHGGPTGVALEDDRGMAADVTTRQLVRLVGSAGDSLRLVVLNTCDSASQAKPIASVVDAAIGMNRSIGDEAARAFSSQLYSSLAEGVHVDRAFAQACLQISLAGIAEDTTPALFVRPGVDMESLRFTT